MPPVTLHFVDESAAIDLVSMVDAMEAVAQALSAKYLGEAEVFPVVMAHGSTTPLLDDLSGFPRAIVAASHLPALRTAAADGVATRELSRVDAETVALIGAGHQAWYELDAVRALQKAKAAGRAQCLC